MLTRFVKSLIVPPAIRLLTSVRQQPDTKILPAKRRRSPRPRVRACRNLFARLTSQSPPEATGVLCPPGTRRFRAFLCAEKCVLRIQLIENCGTVYFGRASSDEFCCRPSRDRAAASSRSVAENISVCPGLCAGDPPPVLHRGKAAAIRQVKSAAQPFESSVKPSMMHALVASRKNRSRIDARTLQTPPHRELIRSTN